MQPPRLDKRLTPRYGQMSNSWARVVFSRCGLSPSKTRRKFLLKLYAAGFSHKDAANALLQKAGGPEHE